MLYCNSKDLCQKRLICSYSVKDTNLIKNFTVCHFTNKTFFYYYYIVYSCADTRVQTLQSSNKLGSEPLKIDNANDSDGSSVAEQTLGETSFQQRMSSLAKHEVV